MLIEKIKRATEYYEQLSSNTRYVFNKERKCIYVEYWRFNMELSTYIPFLIENIPVKILRK